ncbi:gustatory and pheromone receptor 32a-like [Bactrocera neohumeralis]|uniref:gustatory and pheromone receptor 32a-like n=1 Tax=Bactrocera neohumeralis TaxID=98809 RepID=UPI002164FAC1|nr:gustatory and pheromone receptor 32a-like [Bactrocera neohumeralis]
MRDTSRARATNNVGAEDATNNRRHILVFLRWPLLLLQLIGISPLYTRKGLYEIGLPKRRAIFITRAVLLAKLCLNILHIFYLLSPTMLELLFVKSNTDGMTNVLDIALCILSDATITCSCAANTDKIINILNSYLKLDKLLKQFPDPLTERPLATNKFNRYLIWMLGFNCIAIFTYAKQTAFKSSLYFFVHTLIYLLQNAISFIFVAFISGLLYLLAERLRFVNMLITQYNRSGVSNRVLSRNAINQDEENLRRFAEHSTLIYSLHLDLLNLYKMINEYAGLGLLAFVLYACCGLLTCIYILALNIHILTDDLFYSLWALLWIPYFLTGLVLLATNCAKATREANNTSQILARVYGKGKAYQNIIDKFLTKSIRQDVHFTAYGFFVIDNTTLFKISSALVTYLVILIQFKQLEKSKV